MQSGGLALRSLKDGLLGFATWWRDELWGLVPVGARQLLLGAEARVVLAQLDSGFKVFAEASGRGPTTIGGGGAIMPLPEALKELAGLAASAGAATVGIRLPLSLCYTRCVELPGAARRDLRRILNFDLERATPFKLKDVHTAHMVEGEASTKGKLLVRQLVAKRELVEPLIAQVRRAGLGVAFVDCWRDQPAQALPVNFLETETSADTGMDRLVTVPKVLAALLLLLAASAVLLTLSRYENALGELQARTAQTRSEAAAVRQMLERSDAAVADLGRLQQLKLRHIPAIAILEEVSRLLPDTVWLSDLRVEGETMDISGLAASGAELPPLFERSTIFSNASLTAPLTLDPREDKERFSLRVQIRQPQASRMSRAEGKQ